VAVAATSATPPPPPKVPAVGSVTDLPRLVVEELCGRATGPEGADQLFREACAAYPSDANAARKKLFEVIAKYPASEHTPVAYLFFGELFFHDAEAGDPTKYEIARQAYEKVLAYPVATTPAYAYAAYRCALAWRATNENEKALQRFQNAVTKHPDHPVQATLVAQAATDGLIATYAVVGEPEAAKSFFRAAALPPKMVAALGEEYLRRGTPSDAVVAVESVLQPGIVGETCVAVEEFASHLKEVDASGATRILARARVLCPSR
jgi:tetratricopeptide (TPR) repeat protein